MSAIGCTASSHISGVLNNFIPDTEHMQIMFEALQQGILVLDSIGKLVYLNQAARVQLQLPEAPSHKQIPEASARPFGISNTTGRPENHFIITLEDRESIIPAQQVMLGNIRVLTLGLACRCHQPEVLPDTNKVIGKSQPVQLLLKKVRRVADSPSSVMIRGESGTGKEVFARAIHNASRRANQPFIAINCAAIPEQLLESELFGYVKGAFTGANQKGSEGMIRQAHGGTLFLDEIGDMSLHLQAKLLRVLDRREVTPVGAAQPIPVDVRVISASHRDFEQLITDNLFREDLFYRLNVVPLELPPLRAREDDIDLLIEHFMGLHSRALARHRPALDPNTMHCLRNWHWPGNIRELSNMIEYLVNVADPTLPVTPNLLPPRMRMIQPAPNNEAKADKRLPDIPNSSTASDLAQLNLELIEKDVISRALERFSNAHDTKQNAAKALGIGIATLYRKIKKYDLEDKAS